MLGQLWHKSSGIYIRSHSDSALFPLSPRPLNVRATTPRGAYYCASAYYIHFILESLEMVEGRYNTSHEESMDMCGAQILGMSQRQTDA